MRMADTINSAISTNSLLSLTPPPIMANPLPQTLTTPTPTTVSTSTNFRHPGNIQDDTPVLELDNFEELSDNFMGNHMQYLKNKVLNNGMLQNCTLNNPVFNFTIQK